jgi:hypothetical protein
MSSHSTISSDAAELRQSQLADLAAENEPGWESQFQPGAFGCHELLDRTSLLGDLVESQLLEHPACVLNPKWHQLALNAVEALRELYQQVGAEHLAEEAPRNGQA